MDVAEELDEVALLGDVADEPLPQAPLLAELSRERVEASPVDVLVGGDARRDPAPDLLYPSSSDGFSLRTASETAWPNSPSERKVGRESTTGVSLP